MVLALQSTVLGETGTLAVLLPQVQTSGEASFQRYLLLEAKWYLFGPSPQWLLESAKKSLEPSTALILQKVTMHDYRLSVSHVNEETPANKSALKHHKWVLIPLTFLQACCVRS